MGQNICCPLSTKYSYNLSIVFLGVDWSASCLEGDGLTWCVIIRERLTVLAGHYYTLVIYIIPRQSRHGQIVVSEGDLSLHM